jgi:hypothetical protein
MVLHFNQAMITVIYLNEDGLVKYAIRFKEKYGYFSSKSLETLFDIRQEEEDYNSGWLDFSKFETKFYESIEKAIVQKCLNPWLLSERDQSALELYLQYYSTPLVVERPNVIKKMVSSLMMKRTNSMRSQRSRIGFLEDIHQRQQTEILHQSKHTESDYNSIIERGASRIRDVMKSEQLLSSARSSVSSIKSRLVDFNARMAGQKHSEALKSDSVKSRSLRGIFGTMRSGQTSSKIDYFIAIPAILHVIENYFIEEKEIYLGVAERKDVENIHMMLGRNAV